MYSSTLHQKLNFRPSELGAKLKENMKRFLWIAVVALLTNATDSFAQGSAYNMVIETTNGTRITLGQDDVKSISFNNGQLVMTGPEIGNVMRRAADTDNYYTKDEIDAKITAIWNAIDRLYYSPSNYVTKEEIFYLLDNYYTKAEVDVLISELVENGGVGTRMEKIAVSQQSDGALALSGLSPNSTVQVCRLSGEQVRTGEAMSDGTASINIESLPAGVYIVRSDNGSAKFVKRN